MLSISTEWSSLGSMPSTSAVKACHLFHGYFCGYSHLQAGQAGIFPQSRRLRYEEGPFLDLSEVVHIEDWLVLLPDSISVCTTSQASQAFTWLSSESNSIITRQRWINQDRDDSLAVLIPMGLRLTPQKLMTWTTSTMPHFTNHKTFVLSIIAGGHISHSITCSSSLDEAKPSEVERKAGRKTAACLHGVWSRPADCSRGGG